MYYHHILFLSAAVYLFHTFTYTYHQMNHVIWSRCCRSRNVSCWHTRASPIIAMWGEIASLNLGPTWAHAPTCTTCLWFHRACSCQVGIFLILSMHALFFHSAIEKCRICCLGQSNCMFVMQVACNGMVTQPVLAGLLLLCPRTMEHRGWLLPTSL